MLCLFLGEDYTSIWDGDENVPNDWEYDLVGRPDELSSAYNVESKKLM